jgi:hypothetical protein
LKNLKNNLQVLRLDDNTFMKTSDKNHKFFCIAHLNGLKYIDYTLIEQSDIEKAHDDHKDELNEGAGATEDARGETQMMDQELIDARIDNTFQILDRVMQESDDYEKIKDL